MHEMHTAWHVSSTMDNGIDEVQLSQVIELKKLSEISVYNEMRWIN